MGKKKGSDEISLKKIAGGVIVGIILLIVVLVILKSSTSPPAGHKAVVVSGFGDIGSQYDEGFQIINPFVTVEYVRYNTQDLEEPISILTNDGFNVPVDFQVTFHLQEDKVGEIHTKTPNYKETVIRNILRSEVRKTAADMNLTGEAINKQRTAFEVIVENRCIERMSDYFITVESLNVRNIDLPISLLTANENRAAAKIDIETAAFELDAERQRAQKEQVKAAAEANSTIILAKGQAESLTILSEVSESMEPDVMDYILSLRYIAALQDPDCNVKFVIVPMDGQPLILDMGELEELAASNTNSTA